MLPYFTWRSNRQANFAWRPAAKDHFLGGFWPPRQFWFSVMTGPSCTQKGDELPASVVARMRVGCPSPARSLRQMNLFTTKRLHHFGTKQKERRNIKFALYSVWSQMDGEDTESSISPQAHTRYRHLHNSERILQVRSRNIVPSYIPTPLSLSLSLSLSRVS